MLEAAIPVQSEIASALGWWADAGVDVLIDEVPIPWTERGKRPSAPPPAPVAEAPAQNVEALIAKALALPLLDPHCPPQQRIAASGHAGSDLMILIDMPEPDDWREGRLIGGEAGILFDKMLSAMNRSRDNCYIAALCPARIPGGRIPDEIGPALVALMRRHIALSAPKGVWAMGMAVSRALIGADALPGRANLRKINHDGGNVNAVASFSPRFLLQNPKRKAAAWADMQALMRGFEA